MHSLSLAVALALLAMARPAHYIVEVDDGLDEELPPTTPQTTEEVDVIEATSHVTKTEESINESTNPADKLNQQLNEPTNLITKSTSSATEVNETTEGIRY